MPDATVKFIHVGSSTMRDTIAQMGKLPMLEFGLLKRDGTEKLRWGTADKALLLDMTTDVLRATRTGAGPSAKSIEVRVRSLCHSRGVTADYLSYAERFNMKSCALIIGRVGEVDEPWTEMVQAAVYLHAHEFNCLWIDIPAFSTDTERWFKYGPDLMCGALRHLGVRTVDSLACGVGAMLLFKAMTMFPEQFGTTHMVYNPDCMERQILPFQTPKLEDVLRERTMQIWLCYNDEYDVYDHLETQSMPGRIYDGMSKLQSRLEGERRRGRRSLPYDEVIITEELNQKRTKHSDVVTIGHHELLVFSDSFLVSIARFLELPPRARQDDLIRDGGLVADLQLRSIRNVLDEGSKELPALRAQRLEPLPEVRREAARANRRRRFRFDEAVVLCLEAPPGTMDMLPQGRFDKGVSRLSMVASAPALPAAAATEALQDMQRRTRAESSSIDSQGRIIVGDDESDTSSQADLTAAPKRGSFAGGFEATATAGRASTRPQLAASNSGTLQGNMAKRSSQGPG